MQAREFGLQRKIHVQQVVDPGGPVLLQVELVAQRFGEQAQRTDFLDREALRPGDLNGLATADGVLSHQFLLLVGVDRKVGQVWTLDVPGRDHAEPARHQAAMDFRHDPGEVLPWEVRRRAHHAGNEVELSAFERQRPGVALVEVRIERAAGLLPGILDRPGFQVDAKGLDALSGQQGRVAAGRGRQSSMLTSSRDFLASSSGTEQS